MRISTTTLITYFLALQCYGLDIACAEDKFTMNSPVEKQIVTQKTITFDEQKYNPIAEIHFLNIRADLSYISQENIVLAYLSSVLIGDKNWQMELLTQAEMQKLSAMDINVLQQQIETYKLQAQALITNNKVFYSKNISLSNTMSLIEVKVLSSDNSTQIMKLPIPLVKEGANWKVCRECGRDNNNDLFKLLQNLNYDFDDSQKVITELEINTIKPAAPYFTFTSN